MLHYPFLVFIFLTLIGIALAILGFRFSHRTRKVLETAGAILFHVGVFGILYQKLAFKLFLSLVTIVSSGFILVDPLKFRLHLNERVYKLVGNALLFFAVVFLLDHFTGFPVLLWAIPIMIYLVPYVLPAAKNHLRLVWGVSWLVVLLYVSFIGYVVYLKFYPPAEVNTTNKWTNSIHLPNEAPTALIYQPIPSVSEVKTVPTLPPQVIEVPFSELETLKTKYQELLEENRLLRLKLEE